MAWPKKGTILKGMHLILEWVGRVSPFKIASHSQGTKRIKMGKLLPLKVYPFTVILSRKYAPELSWSRGHKTFSCSTQLNMKFFLLINVKMPTVVGILTFMSGKYSIQAYLSL